MQDYLFPPNEKVIHPNPGFVKATGIGKNIFLVGKFNSSISKLTGNVIKT